MLMFNFYQFDDDNARVEDLCAERDFTHQQFEPQGGIGGERLIRRRVGEWVETGVGVSFLIC